MKFKIEILNKKKYIVLITQNITNKMEASDVEIKALKQKLEKLEQQTENLELIVIKLKNNDSISRNGISKLQNLTLGLFKKFLSKVTHTHESKVNLIQWAGLKHIMCNNPNHLSEFSVKSIITYCGTDPVCPTCRAIKNDDDEFDLEALSIRSEDY
jgi:hypothetical protein